MSLGHIPTFADIKLVIPADFQLVILLSTYCREDRANPRVFPYQTAMFDTDDLV